MFLERDHPLFQLQSSSCLCYFEPFRYQGKCTIQFDNYVVITGGYADVSATVDVFDDNGFLKALPSLVEGRGFHGCGHYIDDIGNLVKRLSQALFMTRSARCFAKRNM